MAVGASHRTLCTLVYEVISFRGFNEHLADGYSYGLVKTIAAAAVVNKPVAFLYPDVGIKIKVR